MMTSLAKKAYISAAEVSLIHAKVKQNLLSAHGQVLDLDLPQANKARPETLLLPDDPNFDVSQNSEIEKVCQFTNSKARHVP